MVYPRAIKFTISSPVGRGRVYRGSVTPDHKAAGPSAPEFWDLYRHPYGLTLTYNELIRHGKESGGHAGFQRSATRPVLGDGVPASKNFL